MTTPTKTIIRPQVEMMVEGLGFPEGPVAHADGTVYVCDVHGGLVRRISGGVASIFVDLGGAPNGLAIGPDEWLYVANNGGAMRWERKDDLLLSHGFEPDGFDARIERVHLRTGAVERILDQVDGHKLQAIDDLVFDATGGFWFTDLGRDGPRGRSYGGIYWSSADGAHCREVFYPLVDGANGIGLSPDGRTLYATEYGAGRLWAWSIEDSRILAKTDGHPHGGRLIWQAPDALLLDSLAVTASGNIVVAAQPAGVFAVISPSGMHLASVYMPDGFPTNLCFDPNDSTAAYATLSSTGRLAKLRWCEPGLRPAFN